MFHVLQQLLAKNVDIATFLDEDIKPRQPPNPSKPGILLRIEQPETRILEPREYPEGILGGILNLVQSAGSVDAAKTALRAAVETRKRAQDQAASVRQVLSRDLCAASDMLKSRDPSNDSRKRAAVSLAQDARPAKQQVTDTSTSWDASTSQDEGSSNDIVKHMKDVPEGLRDMLKTLSNIKRTAKPPSAIIATAFHGEQSGSELFRLFIGAFAAYDAMDYEDEAFIDYQRLQAHSHKHYMFRHLADQAISKYEKLQEETGLVLHENLVKIFETPLPCCPSKPTSESGDGEYE